MKNNSDTKFRNNIIWILFERIYSMLASLVVGALTARYLGPSNYGMLGYVTSIVGMLTPIAMMGLDSILVVELSQRKEERGKILGSANTLRTIGTSVTIGISLIVGMLIEPNNPLFIKMLIIQLLSVAVQIGNNFTFVFHADLESKYVEIGNFIGLTAISIAKILFLANHCSVVWFSVAILLQSFFSVGYIILAFYRRKRIRMSTSWHEVRNLLDKGHHFIIISMSISILIYFDRIIIGRILSEEAAGIYTAADTISTLWLFIPTAIITSFTPLIAEEYKQNKDTYWFMQKKMYCIVTIICIVISAGIVFFQDFVVQVLYGSDYTGITKVLWILLIASTLSVIGSARSVWILCENLQKYAKWYVIGGAALNIVLDILFVPRLNILGAALSTCLSQYVSVFIFPLISKKTSKFFRMYVGSFKVIKTLLRR